MRICKFLFLIPCLLLCGCGVSAPAAPTPELSPAVTQAPASRVISAQEAKAIIDSEEEFFLLDVREPDEYNAGHIPGAVCIPYTRLEERRSELPQDHGAEILVYCRSGRRSAIAAETLVNMGYGNVLDFGGIIDWPYDTVTSESEAQAEAVNAAEAENGCEHCWTTYDCLSERCSKCGEMRDIY